ncbi:MAG TPA: squalene/phytoene synthase family protein [bacterium]|nr:squalene/phytoene synthase family protein [bacterium]
MNSLAVGNDPFAYCRAVLERSGSSFHTAIKFLPAAQRRAMTAFYAFCRAVDDAVDDAPDRETARRELARWHRRVEQAFAGAPTDPIGIELFRAHEHFGIRREQLDLIVEGCSYDLELTRYATFADLYEYCYRVASAVGLVVVALTGRGRTDLENYAEFTGIAVQLTNIIRDIGEDGRNGRIYLPVEDLRAFGVAEADILARRDSENFRRLVEFEAARTREFYRIAEAALPRDLRGRLPFAETVRETYLTLQNELDRARYPVLERKVKLSKARKVAIAAKHLAFSAIG